MAPDSGFNTGKDMPMRNQYGLRQQGGIICPANRDDQGPAKQRIHCLIWKDMPDFWENSEASGWPTFCSKICHYGHMDAMQRSVAFRAHRRWLNLRKDIFNRQKWLSTLRLRDRSGRML